jgi:spermidine/putrescine transport system permease protein
VAKAVTVEPAPPGKARRRRKQTQESATGVWYPRGFWPSFLVPGTLVLIVLFVVPFYVTLAVAFGGVDPIFGSPVPVWNPLHWDTTAFRFVMNQTFLIGGIYRPAMERTLLYVAIATVICILVGYPVAYYIARYGGRRKTLLLLALIAPFWIAYLMRMLAWVNLLQDDGLVNRALEGLGVISQPVQWLTGQPITVVLGLVYGYIPYMILPLFGALDRIDGSLLEAARDLGASPRRTFLRITLPMSVPALLAGTIIVILPMFGDYYTQDLMSASPKTSMLGNVIDEAINSPFVGRAASLVLVLTGLLLLPMLYYLFATRHSVQEAG